MTARARPDHEIVRPSCDRPDELRYERWNVAPIAIEKHYDVAFRRDRASACCARPPVTTRRSYNTCASFTRPRTVDCRAGVKKV